MSAFDPAVEVPVGGLPDDHPLISTQFALEREADEFDREWAEARMREEEWIAWGKQFLPHPETDNGYTALVFGRAESDPSRREEAVCWSLKLWLENFDPERYAPLTTTQVASPAAPYLKALPVTSPEPGDGELADKLKPLDQEFRRGVPEAQYYAQDLVAAGALTVLAGYIGAGKTPSILRMARALLAGEDFLGFSFSGVPEGFRVAYLTQEGEATFIPAAAEAGLNDPALSSRLDVGYIHAFATDDFEQVVEATARKLAESGGGLLIVDTLIDWTQARDENDSAVMTAALRPLVVAVQRHGIAALASVHTVKDVDGVTDTDADVRHVRGSGAVISNASIVYLLKKAKPRQDGGVRCLKRVRSRLATSTPERRYTLMEDGQLRRVEIIEQTLRERDSDEERVVAELIERNGNAEERELRRALHLKAADLDLSLDELQRAGRIRRSGEGRPGDPKRVQVV